VNTTISAVSTWRRRHIVICNWRDGGHPMAGGAELYCEQVAEQLHRDGVEVTYLTARAPGQAAREEVSYGRAVRGGGTYTVYLFVLFWLLLNRRTIDAVIDSQNGIPFFTPLAVRRRTPVALLIHHVHQDQFDVHFPRPAARIGQLLENQVSRWVYGNRAVCAVSPSSRAEIRKRLSFRGPVHLAPCGQQLPMHQRRDPSPQPRIVCVGRLVSQKRFDILLRALPALLVELPKVELHLIGDGEARAELEQLAADLDIGDAVRFHGRVADELRDCLVESAWLTASASMGEGWGLSIMESAAAGVPAVAFSVPGLRDTIRPGETGWLVERSAGDSPAHLAETLITALDTLSDGDTAEEWSMRCQAWAARFTWEATSGHLVAALTAEERRLRRRDPDRRPGSDSAVLVSLPTDQLAATDLSSLRVTDLVDIDGGRTALLLCGADEQDGQRILRRLGIDDASAGVHVRLARHRDLLGWRTHPPVRARSKSPVPSPRTPVRQPSTAAVPEPSRDAPQ
jgi:glycosyltransferase involved in cell wall biosynthesis